MGEPTRDGSAEYWKRRCHMAWEKSDQDAWRILELRSTLVKAAKFLESAATYQDRPGAMEEHEALAAEIREVLIPPGVKALRAPAPGARGQAENETEEQERG